MNFDGIPLAPVERYLWKEKNLIVVKGTFSELLRGRKEYEAHHGIDSQNHGETLDALACLAALTACSQPDPFSWAFSINTPDSKLDIGTGFFVAAEPQGMIVARHLPTTRKEWMVTVQRAKTGEQPSQSSFLPKKGGDPVRVFEQYFETSEQRECRIALDPTTAKGVLFQSMPEGHLEELQEASAEELLNLVEKLLEDEKLTRLAEHRMFYECLCTDEYVLNMLTSLPISQQEELWEGQESLRIECPRCSREFVIRQPQ